MVGKLTAVLIRKEAEAYRAQGLYEEAFALYDELLSSSPNIGETLKSDIRSQMDVIAEEMEAFSDHQDEQLLSSKEMMQLKNGWDNEASVADMLISAQGLCQIGAHNDALIEFAKLLEAGIEPEKVISSAIDSFSSLFNAKKLPVAADKWLRDIYPDGRKVLSVHLLFLRELSRSGDNANALQYCRYVRSKPALPADLIKKLDAAQIKYKAAVKQGGKRSTPKMKSEPEPIEKPIAKESADSQFDDNDRFQLESRPEPMTITGPMDRKQDDRNQPNPLKELLGEEPDDFMDDEFPESPQKERGRQLHFIKIILFGWFDRLLKTLLPKKRKRSS